MYRKISVTIGSLLLATTAFASHPDDSVIAPAGINVVAPPSVSSWTLGLEALYMAPSNADFQYAQIQSGTDVQTYDNKSVSPSSSLGGEFDATYHFAGSSRDVEVALTHVVMDDSSDVSTTTETMNNPFGITGTKVHPEDYADGDVDNNIDAVDVVFGQTFTVGQTVSLRPFAGIRYADLENNDYAQYQNRDPSTGESNLLGSGRIDSGFEGGGPRAGLDAKFQAGSGISFVGDVGVSLLIGEISTKITKTVNTSNSATNTPYDQDSNTSLVPEADAELGINYHHAIDMQNAFDIQLGYQAVNYFDAIDNNWIDATTPNTVNNDSDIGYHGPYLRFQLDLV